VYYDPFTGSPTEYEMYDIVRDPLEMTNLAHAAHRTAASDVERERLHRRLTDVMRANGTLPDEIDWPAVEDFDTLREPEGSRLHEEPVAADL
jgi:hypothetical protein